MLSSSTFNGFETNIFWKQKKIDENSDVFERRTSKIISEKRSKERNQFSTKVVAKHACCSITNYKYSKNNDKKNNFSTFVYYGALCGTYVCDISPISCLAYIRTEIKKDFLFFLFFHHKNCLPAVEEAHEHASKSTNSIVLNWKNVPNLWTLFCVFRNLIIFHAINILTVAAWWYFVVKSLFNI